MKLSVNLNKIALLRNARGETYPSPLRAAILSQKYGADSITIHLREDRRHINDKDLITLSKFKKIPINLELSMNKKITKEDVNKAYVKIQKKIHPDISPETARLSSIVNEAKDIVLNDIS